MNNFCRIALIIFFSVLMSTSALATNGDNLIGVGPISRAMGGVPANGIARGDGVGWSARGEGVLDGEVNALEVPDDGTVTVRYPFRFRPGESTPPILQKK